MNPASTFSQGVVDGMRGALLGATIVLIYLTFRLKHSRERDFS
jgi:hypothetical protein